MRAEPNESSAVSDTDIMTVARHLQRQHGASIIAVAARRIRRALGR